MSPFTSLYNNESDVTVLTRCRLRKRPYVNNIAVKKKCLHKGNELVKHIVFDS